MKLSPGRAWVIVFVLGAAFWFLVAWGDIMNGIKKKTAAKEADEQNIIKKISCLNLTKKQSDFLFSVVGKVNREESYQDIYSRQCVAELKDNTQEKLSTQNN